MILIILVYIICYLVAYSVITFVCVITRDNWKLKYSNIWTQNITCIKFGTACYYSVFIKLN